MHHDLLLDILSQSCNYLNISIGKKVCISKETNEKQKNQKPQNENICLTSVNAENNCKFSNYVILK